MSEPDGLDHLQTLEAGDEIWVILGDENWLKRIVEITPLPDGSFDLALEDAVDLV